MFNLMHNQICKCFQYQKEHQRASIIEKNEPDYAGKDSGNDEFFEDPFHRPEFFQRASDKCKNLAEPGRNFSLRTVQEWRCRGFFPTSEMVRHFLDYTIILSLWTLQRFSAGELMKLLRKAILSKL